MNLIYQQVKDEPMNEYQCDEIEDPFDEVIFFISN